MSKLVRNEQRKLTATYVNGGALAVMAVGGFTPIVGIAQSASPSSASFVVVICCLFGSLALHLTARQVLKGLEE